MKTYMVHVEVNDKFDLSVNAEDNENAEKKVMEYINANYHVCDLNCSDIVSEETELQSNGRDELGNEPIE